MFYRRIRMTLIAASAVAIVGCAAEVKQPEVPTELATEDGEFTMYSNGEQLTLYQVSYVAGSDIGFAKSVLSEKGWRLSQPGIGAKVPDANCRGQLEEQKIKMTICHSSHIGSIVMYYRKIGSEDYPISKQLKSFLDLQSIVAAQGKAFAPK